MNATIRKFGWPATLVAEYAHWLVLLRPAAPTLGSLVLAARSSATAYSDLPPEAFAEQGRVVADIEKVLAVQLQPERMNYLMLMMVDPHVHFHVIPRYEGVRSRQGTDFIDAGWPKVPDLSSAVPLDEAMVADQVAWLKEPWPQSN